MKIKIRLDIEACDLPVEGNASGVAPDIDKQVELEIYSRLKGGVATTGPAYAGLQYREMCDCYGG